MRALLLIPLPLLVAPVDARAGGCLPAAEPACLAGDDSACRMEGDPAMTVDAVRAFWMGCYPADLSNPGLPESLWGSLTADAASSRERFDALRAGRARFGDSADPEFALKHASRWYDAKDPRLACNAALQGGLAGDAAALDRLAKGACAPEADRAEGTLPLVLLALHAHPAAAPAARAIVERGERDRGKAPHGYVRERLHALRLLALAGDTGSLPWLREHAAKKVNRRVKATFDVVTRYLEGLKAGAPGRTP